MNHKNLLLFACACCTLIQSAELVITSRITIDDRDQAAIIEELNADGQALTRKYADADGVHAVETTVQVTRCEVCSTGGNKESLKCNCGKPRDVQDEQTKCNCGKPRDIQDEQTKCNCGKPRDIQDEQTKCNCGKPRDVQNEQTKCNCGKPRDIQNEQTKCNCGKPRVEGEETKCNCGKPRPQAPVEETKCCGSKPTKADDRSVAECTECQGHVQTTEMVAVDANGQRVCGECREQLRSCSSCCKDKCCKKCKKCCNKCCNSTSTTTTSTCNSCCK